MWRRIGYATAAALILVALGCQHNKSAVSTKVQPDPLLISRKPVEGKPTSYTSSTAWREPQPPAAPAPSAVVQRPVTTQSIPVGYRPTQDTGATIGKPRWLPDGQ